jgi:O-antigen/teichoic acid export membrane protein
MAKNTSVLTIMNIATLLLSLVFTIIIARSFGDVNFGEYSSAVALTSLYALIMDLGFNQLIIREVSREKEVAGKFLGNISIIKLVLAIIFFITIVITTNVLNFSYNTQILTYIMSIYAICTSYGGLFRAIFHGFERMEYNSLITILEKIFIVLSSFFMVYLGTNFINVVSVFIIAGIINVTLSLLITVKKFTKIKLEIDSTFWKKTIVNAIPFGITDIFIFIFDRIDIIMLSILIGEAAVGWYNAAVTIIVALGFIPSVIMNSAFPILSRFYLSAENSLEYAYVNLFRYIFIITLPISIIISLFSNQLILLIYGNAFANAIIVLKIIAWWHLFGSIGWLLGTTLQSINKQKMFAFAALTGAIFNVIINLILIPKLSYIGASLSTLISDLILLSILFYFVSKYLYRLPLFKIIIKPLISGIIMSIFIILFNNINLFVIVPISLLLYLTVLYILGEISKEDIKMLKYFLKMYGGIIEFFKTKNS